MKVAPKVLLARSRSMTTAPLELSCASGSWLSTTWAEAKNRLPYAASTTTSPAGSTVGAVSSVGPAEVVVIVGYLTGTLLLLIPPLPRWAELLFPLLGVAISVQVLLREHREGTSAPAL
jgi:hypothetical protein